VQGEAGEERRRGLKPMKNQPVIIIKKRRGGHGGHHGGAWKVAFADFMTAMFAFFLVMWIVGQSASVKSAVAGYFRDPGVFDFEKSTSMVPGGQKGILPEPKPGSSDHAGDAEKLEQAAARIRQALGEMPSLDTVTSLEMIERLLKAGANPNLQLKLLPPYRAVGADRGADTMLSIGTTPLIRAAKAGDTAAIRLLLAHGANPNLPQQGGITPIMAAAGLGSSNIDTRGSLKTQDQAIQSIEVLLGGGGDINLQDKQGRSALHGAAFWGWNDVVKALAAHRAQLAVKDAKGFTPLDYALGKAGGQGRGGQGVTVNQGTAQLLEDLMAHPLTAQRSGGALD